MVLSSFYSYPFIDIIVQDFLTIYVQEIKQNKLLISEEKALFDLVVLHVNKLIGWIYQNTITILKFANSWYKLR